VLEFVKISKYLEPSFLSLFNVKLIYKANLTCFTDDFVKVSDLLKGETIQILTLEVGHVRILIFIIILIY